MHRLATNIRCIYRVRSAATNYSTGSSRTLAAVAGFTPATAQSKLNSEGTSSVLFGQDEVMKQIKESSKQFKSKTVKFLPNEYYEDQQVVYTTGIISKVDGTTAARIGVFWGTNDEANIYKEISSENKSEVSMPIAELDAVVTALRQAVDKKLSRVIVKTDSIYVSKCASLYLKTWRNNGYLKRDGTPVKNRKYLEELDRLLTQIDAKVIYEDIKQSRANRVLEFLRTDETIRSKIESDATLLEPEIQPTQAPKHKNVAYVSGKLHTSNDGFIIGGYGVHWPEQKELDKSVRFTEFPLTHFRTQLAAIITALETAIESNLPQIHIVTDSDRFLRFYRREWKKLNGDPMANAAYYHKIKELENAIQTTYSYLPPESTTEIAQALVLAEDGLAYPTKKQIEYQAKRKAAKAKQEQKKLTKEEE
ncbi:hypothetical protein M3Y96_01140700 [Aphelenchoides besseyi]|nr:hypothetical protein M3Y96_01140700 [Aphelenchoides besseyi]